MIGSTTLGRLSAAEAAKPVIYDAPEKLIAALLTSQDAMIDAIKALTAKLDADAGVTDTTYAALISNGLTKIALME
jgi:hypothetical protein